MAGALFCRSRLIKSICAQVNGIQALKIQHGDHRDLIDAIERHVFKIRTDPLTQHATIVVMIEANAEAVVFPSLVQSHLNRLPKVVFMYSESRASFKTPSIVTTHHDKERYAQGLNSALHQRKIVLREHLHLYRDDMSKMDVIDKCRKQLDDFQIEAVPSGNPLVDADKRFFSGKRSGCDDIAMALQIALLYGALYLGDPNWYRRSRPGPLFVPAWDYTRVASSASMEFIRETYGGDPNAKRLRL